MLYLSYFSLWLLVEPRIDWYNATVLNGLKLISIALASCKNKEKQYNLEVHCV